MQHSYLRLLEATASRDYPAITDLCTPDLAVSLHTDLERLHAHGYRLQLKHRWDGVIERKLYSYARLLGLSAEVMHNFPGDRYVVDVVYFGTYPLKYEYKLVGEAEKQQEEAVVPSLNDPFSLAGVPRDSPRLRKLLHTYPLEVREVSIGFLSQRKFHMTDLYSKKRVVSGEAETDEYEFHMLKVCKAGPADQDRYESESEYRRFLDVNFAKYTHRWLISDIDQFYGLSLLPAS